MAVEAVAMTSPNTAHPSQSIKVSIEHYNNLLTRISTGCQLGQRDLRTAVEFQHFLANFYRAYETHRRQRRSGERTGALVARQAFA